MAQAATPTPTPCSLPASGHIASDAVYTLTTDCAQTGRLVIGTEGSTTKITVTINGGGNTITGTDGVTTIIVHNNVEFNISNVTFVDGGRSSKGALAFTSSEYSATISNVTFKDTSHTALHFDNADNTRVTHSLSSILIEDADGVYFSRTHGIPAGIHTIGPVNLNINRIVLRNISRGNAAIGANDNYSVPKGPARKGTITFSGCITADGVLPLVYYGTIVDNTNGATCTGTIGNSGSSALQYTQKANATCGLPDGGWVFGSQTFTLTGTCTLSETLLIPASASVVIDGGGNTINLNGLTVGIRAWGDLTLRNVVIIGAGLTPLVTYLDKTVHISESTFRDNAGPLIFQDSIATLDEVTIENHAHNSAEWSSLPPLPSAVYVNLSTRMTIRDSVFRGNTGGVGAIHAGAPYQYGSRPHTTLEGDNTFENNSPTDIYAPHGLRPPPPPKDEGPGSGGGGGGGGSGSVQPTPVTWSSSMCYFCPDLEARGFRLSATHGLASGVQMRQIGRDGIGNQAVLDDGFIDAVDVWGYVEQGVEVCFPQIGQLILLDATTSPRVIVSLNAYSKDGMTCTSLDRPGTVVLKAGPPAPMATSPPPPAPTTAPPQYQSLSGCMVRTNDILNFRETPGGARMHFVDPWGQTIAGWLPSDVTLTALQRTPNWFMVDYHGTRGWIHADYVSPRGVCS